MTEHLLDRAEIRAAFQEVGGEGMTQRVGMHAGLCRRVAGPDAEPASDV